MKWLVAMECSAVIRDALRARGHDAWSCDVKPCEGDPRWHIQANVFSHRVVNGGWDGMIAHPDCTFLTKSGAGHMHIPWRKEAMMAAVYNVRALWAFPVRLKAIENPSGRLSTLWRPPDQTIQPHMFGHPEFKATCWWLDGLPPLVPTNQLDVPARGTREYVLWNRVHREGPGKKRGDQPQPNIVGHRRSNRGPVGLGHQCFARLQPGFRHADARPQAGATPRYILRRVSWVKALHSLAGCASIFRRPTLRATDGGKSLSSGVMETDAVGGVGHAGSFTSMCADNGGGERG